MTGHMTKTRLTGSLLFVFLLSLSAILAACGGGGGTTGATGATTLRVNPAPGQPNADFFNPFFTSNGNSDYGTQGFLYETLYYVNPISGKDSPWLASSYSYSSDLTSLTFHLNPKVKWNDGKALTSNDVVFTFNLMKQFPALDTNSLWATLLKGVTASDNNIVVFSLQHADSTALYRIGDQQFIVPQHVWSTVSNPVTYTNDKNPVGTGPYVLSNYTAQLITYKVNSGYWGAAPAVKEIQVPSLKDNTTAITDMVKGQLDWTGTGWNPDYDTSFTQKDPTHNHEWFSASNTVMLYLNLTKAPFNDLQVRKAISAAINLSQLPQGVAQYAKVANPTGVITPVLSSWISSQYSSSSATYSTSQAESILTADGYAKDSAGFYAKGGKEINFKLDVVNGWNDWDQDTAFIAKDLQAAGMNVSINTQANYTPYFNAISTGDYDAALSWTNAGPTPFYAYQGLLSSANATPAGKAVGGTDFERWGTATGGSYATQVDQYLKQYEQSSSLSAQQNAMAGIEGIMVNQLPVIPLTVNVYWDEYTTTNWTNWPTASNAYASGAPYTAPDNEQVVLNLKPAA